MGKFDNKIMVFLAALSDVYKDEGERESFAIPHLDLKENELTEDFTAMVYAVYMMFKQITGDDTDIIGFTHTINRLIVQHLMSDN